MWQSIEFSFACALCSMCSVIPLQSYSFLFGHTILPSWTQLPLLSQCSAFVNQLPLWSIILFSLLYKTKIKSVLARNVSLTMPGKMVHHTDLFLAFFPPPNQFWFFTLHCSFYICVLALKYFTFHKALELLYLFTFLSHTVHVLDKYLVIE